MLEPNTILQERYQVARLIGQGGMGAVYQAVDLRLGNTVALKQTLIPGGQIGKAFEREARLLAGLRHPSLAKVIDHFADTSGQYLVMEYIPGDDLATLLERRGMPFGVSEVLGWATQLLRVLEYLHTREPPILHRDIKPQNVKLTAEGVVVLLDFGLAKGDPSALTQVSVTGSVFGYTPHYAPLEQIHNSGTDARSDLYALAATLHHLLTGAKPIDALTRATMVLRRQPDPLRSPTELNPRVPPDVSQVLMQALSLNQDDRPIDAAAMRAALTEAAAGVDLPPPAAELPKLRAPAPHFPAAAPASEHRVITRTARQLALLRKRVASTPLLRTLPRGAYRWALPVTALVVVMVLLIATSIRRDSVTLAPRPTAAGTVATSQSPSPATPRPPATTPAVAGTSGPTPTVGEVSPDPARASSLDPPSAFSGSLPITVTVRGERLDSVREFHFAAPGGAATITPVVQRSNADEAELVIDALPIMQAGEQTFTLFLDGVAQSYALTLRDYRELKEIRGVQDAYAYTGRVQSDASGAFTQMLSEPGSSGLPVALLRTGDQVDLISDAVPGWYQVRLWTEGQATRTNVVGWVERWLVDGEGVPERVTLDFRGSLIGTPTDAAVQCGTQFRSSIYGSVNRPSPSEGVLGKGIAGALVRVTSSAGQPSYTQRTDEDGEFNFPGLGCTTWVVELLEVPSTTFNTNSVSAKLNGGLYTSAEIRFRQQP